MTKWGLITFEWVLKGCCLSFVSLIICCIYTFTSLLDLFISTSLILCFSATVSWLPLACSIDAMCSLSGVTVNDLERLFDSYAQIGPHIVTTHFLNGSPNVSFPLHMFDSSQWESSLTWCQLHHIPLQFFRAYTGTKVLNGKQAPVSGGASPKA